MPEIAGIVRKVEQSSHIQIFSGRKAEIDRKSFWQICSLEFSMRHVQS